MMYRTLLLLLLLAIAVIGMGSAAAAAADKKYGLVISKAECNQTCVNSNVLIPFPFGIGKGCYDNSSEHYEIVCKPSSSSSSSSSSSGAFNPFLRKLDIQIFQITFHFDYYDNYNVGNIDARFGYNTMIVASERERLCTSENIGSSITSSSVTKKRSLIGSPFYFSYYNQFRVQGCTGRINIRNRKGGLIGGCSVFCDPSYNYSFSDYDYYCDGIGDYGGGGYYEQDYYYSLRQAIWSWSTPQISFGYDSTHLNRSIECYNTTPGSACMCTEGFHGNPYLPYGCQAIAGRPKKKAMILGKIVKNKPTFG